MYSNGYRVLDFNEKSYVLCCKALYNNKKVNDLHDLSYYGKKIDTDIKKIMVSIMHLLEVHKNLNQ